MNLEPLSHIFYLYLHDELGTVSSLAILVPVLVHKDTQIIIGPGNGHFLNDGGGLVQLNFS